MPQDTYQPMVSSPGGPVTAPVERSAPHPFNYFASLVEGFNSERERFVQQRRQGRAAAEADYRETRDREAARFAVQSAFKYNEEMRRSMGAGLMAGVSQTAAAARLQENPDPVNSANPTASTTPQAVIAGAVDSGVVDSARADELNAYAEQQAERVETVTAAQEQGRLSPLGAAASVDNIVQETMSLFTDVDPAVIFSALEAAGISNAGFRELRGALANEQAVDAAEREQYTQAVTLARESVPIELQNLYTEDQLAVIGMNQIRTDAELERAQTELELLIQQGNLSDAEQAREETRLAREAGQSLDQGILGTLAPIFNQIASLNLGEPGQYPQLEAEVTNMINVARQQLPMIVEAHLARSAGTMTVQERQVYRDHYMQMIENTFFTPFEERASSYGPLLQMMQNRMGINMITAAPLLYQLRESGVDLDYTQLVLQNMDDAMAQQLGDELTGLTNDPIAMMNNNTALGFLNRIMAVATGDSTLQELGMETSEAFATVRRIRENATSAILDGTASDALVDSYRNTSMEIAAQALNVSPGATTTVLTNTLLSLTQGSRTRQTLSRLIEDGDEEARIAGLGTRAAVSRNLQALVRSRDLQNSHFRVQFNESSGRFDIVRRSDAPSTVQRFPGGRDGPAQTVTMNPTIPESMRNTQIALNNGLIFLTNTSDWDDDPPQGTQRELRNLYLYGTPTAAMRREAEEQGVSGESAVGDTIRAVQSITTDLQQGRFTIPEPTRPGPGGVEIDPRGFPAGDTATEPAIRAVSYLQERGGLSREDAIALAANFQAEVGPDYGQLATGAGDGGTAFGLAQWREGRVADFRRIIGKHPRDATLEESLDFVIWELQNSESDAFRRLQEADTLDEKIAIVDQFYERSSGEHRSLRVGYGRNLDRAIN